MNKLLLALTVTLLPITLLAGDFKDVKPGKTFEFPRDHGAHPEYPTEWWYFTGHLESKEKRTYGFELTFFRVSIDPILRSGTWGVNSLYLAHAAITDDRGQKYFYEKRTRRPSLKRAGAKNKLLHVWLDTWQAKLQKDGSIELVFDLVDRDRALFLSLSLHPRKAPVLQGDAGYSQKGDDPGDASYYISYTRLLGDGELRIDNTVESVSASAWMDHEILSSKPNDEEIGWDWFAIQLDNGWECMLYHLKRDKKVSSHSSGSCISPAGEKTVLTVDDYILIPLSQWRSSQSGVTYPSGWKIEILPLKMELELQPTVKDQELYSKESASRTYWEGRHTVSGQFSKRDTTGNAYVELVGYNN